MKNILFISCWSMVLMLLAMKPMLATASSFEVVMGRYYLAQSNLASAHTAFANAADTEGKVLKALTSLALLQRETNTVNFLNKLHYDSPENIWQVQTVGYLQSPTRPTPYRTVSGTRGSQLVAILHNIHLPALTQADTDLATFTDNLQLVPLGRSETGYPDISLDRGDILMIRSLLACGRFLVKTANSQNIDLVFNDYLLLEEEPGPATIEKILSRFPDLAKLANSADLPLARNEAKNAITLYNQASAWIRLSRPWGVVRLFNLPGSFGVKSGEVYTSSLADEVKFRAKLAEYANLLDGPAAITGFDDGAIDTFNGKPFFDGLLNVRSILPNFRKNKIRQGDVTESFAKAGGVYPGNTISQTESWLLSETLSCAYNPFAYGLFVPPNLTISLANQGPLTEGNQPQDLFLALGWLWGGSGKRYSDEFGLYWINPITKEFSKLTIPAISDTEWVQAASIGGEYLAMVTKNWMVYPEQYHLKKVRLNDGFSPPSLSISLDNFSVVKVLFSNTDIIFWGYLNQTPFGYGFYKVNNATGIKSEFLRVDSSYQPLVTLDETKTHILAAKVTYNPPTFSGLWVIDKIDLSNGQVIQSTSINSTSPGWSEIMGAKNSILYAFGFDWSSWPAKVNLSSINISSGEVTLLNNNVLPSGRNSQGNPVLDTSGTFALIQSTDLNWQETTIHKIRLSDGVLIESNQIGKSGDEFWFEHLWPSPGSLLFATRSGDVSEEITVAIHLSGDAQNGLDYLLLEPLPLTFRQGNIEQPFSFDLINDSITEFENTLSFTGTPEPTSEASFQIFTLRITDDDGAGVGIFATDNLGKEGRMNPDPFGFRFGIYDPIRFEVRRTGSTSTPLSVKIQRNLFLSSASADDYEISGLDADGESVYFPIGQSSVEILISPKFDLEHPEGTESLVLQVSADPAYGLTESASASASILDNSIYAWWSYQMGLLVANHPPSFDVDGDGMSNLLEMSLGRDPNLPDSTHSVQESRDADGYLTLSFKRWSGGINHADGSYTQYGVNYQPQGTSDIENPNSWTTSAIQVGSVTDTGDGMELVTVRDMLSKTEPRRFLRLKTTLQE